MTLKEFLDYVKEAKSKNTWKEYKLGINKFVEWFGKDADEILALRHRDVVSGEPIKKKRFLREIEKFHANLLKQGYAINSARTMCLGIQQLFRFYEMPVTLPTGSKVAKTVISTKDFPLRPEHPKLMYKVADLRGRVIVSMAKDLGWRIGDFCKLKKDQLPDLELEAPIPFELITEKEDVLAKGFLSQESVDLLKIYLPTLPEDNPYLFPSNRSKYLDGESINRIIKGLASKALIRIPKRRRLRFHCFRKLFLSTCANLGVDVNIAKILVGKQVEKDMLTYLPTVDLRNAFLRVQGVLGITKPAKEIGLKDKRIRELEERLKKQEWTMEAMTRIYGEETRRKAKEEYERLFNEKVSGDLSTGEILLEVGKKLEKRRQEEYKKLIEEPNNNNS